MTEDEITDQAMTKILHFLRPKTAGHQDPQVIVREYVQSAVALAFAAGKAADS